MLPSVLHAKHRVILLKACTTLAACDSRRPRNDRQRCWPPEQARLYRADRQLDVLSIDTDCDSSASESERERDCPHRGTRVFAHREGETTRSYDKIVSYAARSNLLLV